MGGVPEGVWDLLQHESAWPLPRQRRGGKLLPVAQARADQAKDLPDPGCGAYRCVQLHRDVLQPQTPARLQWRRLSGRVRTAGGTIRLVGVYETRGDSVKLPRKVPSRTWRVARNDASGLPGVTEHLVQRGAACASGHASPQCPPRALILSLVASRRRTV